MSENILIIQGIITSGCIYPSAKRGQTLIQLDYAIVLGQDSTSISECSRLLKEK